MPRLDVSDRNYFKVHHDNPTNGPFVSQVLEARAANTRFFAISRRREIKGRFAGVTIVSIAPEYFSEFYSQLPPPGTSALLRSDGAVLVRYPDTPGAANHLPAIRPSSRPSVTVQRPAWSPRRPQPTAVRASSCINGWRSCPIFTSRSASSPPRIIRAWMLVMASHLIFGLPATLTLIGLGFVALRRTERLQQEMRRREATEQALRQAQKMEAVGRLSGGIAHDFNNHAHRHPRQYRHGLAPRRRGQSARPAPARHRRVRPPSAPRRWCSACWRSRASIRWRSSRSTSTGWCRACRSSCAGRIGETITIETVLAGGLWKVAVDPNQLENAILNLAVNARDAMPDGGRLTIETANSYLDEAYVAANSEVIAAGQYVMLAVTDSGTGMTPRRDRARVRAVLHHQAGRAWAPALA